MANPQAEKPVSLGTGFWQLLSSSSMSNLADGLFKVGLPLVALTVTRSPALIAGIMTALTLPWLIAALPAGVVVDRSDRRKLMVFANFARALILVILAVLTASEALTIWVIYAVSFGAGLAEVLYDTAAQSILPQIVSREVLTRANGRLYAAELTANEFVGPPLAGFLVTIGAVAAFATPAGLWLLAAAILVMMRGSFRVQCQSRQRMRTDIGDGLRFLWRNTVLRTLTIMTGVFNVASNATMAVLVVYAVGASSAIGLSETGYGLLLASIAAGSVFGTVVAGAIERKLGRSRSLALGFAAAVLFIGAPALTANPIALTISFFVGGVGNMVWNVIAVSLRQRITPDAMLGRTTGAHRIFAWGGRPLGAALGGLIAELFGLVAVFATMAVLALSLLGLMRYLTDEAIQSAEEAVTTP
jgi:MFS family permease